jgi:hypothetical protein
VFAPPTLTCCALVVEAAASKTAHLAWTVAVQWPCEAPVDGGTALLLSSHARLCLCIRTLSCHTQARCCSIVPCVKLSYLSHQPHLTTETLKGRIPACSLQSGERTPNHSAFYPSRDCTVVSNSMAISQWCLGSCPAPAATEETKDLHRDRALYKPL